MLSKMSSASFQVSQHLCTKLHSQMCLCNDFEYFPFSTSLLLEKQTHTEPSPQAAGAHFMRHGAGLQGHKHPLWWLLVWGGCLQSEHQVHRAMKTHLW